MLLPKHRAPTSPGEVLREEYLIPLKLTQAQLANHLAVTTETINRIVNGKRSISVPMALRLGRGLGTTPDFWLNLQRAGDLWQNSHRLEEELSRIEILKTA